MKLLEELPAAENSYWTTISNARGRRSRRRHTSTDSSFSTPEYPIKNDIISKNISKSSPKRKKVNLFWIAFYKKKNIAP